MKKTSKIITISAALIASLGLSACKEEEVPECVYGPPIPEEVQEQVDEGK
ncbi:MAG: hypothetical protein HUJ53_03395 [Holdemanella sp.]|nr:hypothetical protein [Holdemanella sp.]